MFRLQERSGRPQGWIPKEDFKIDPCETAAAGGELVTWGPFQRSEEAGTYPPAPFADVPNIQESVMGIICWILYLV